MDGTCGIWQFHQGGRPLCVVPWASIAIGTPLRSWLGWGRPPILASMAEWHAASWDEVRAGRVTDVYFTRAVEVLRAAGKDQRVRAEFIVKTIPDGGSWGVLAGTEECLRLLEGRPVSVRGLPEGTVFRPLQPVLEIEGLYTDFALYETPLLGMLCQASGVATKAARFRKLARDVPLVSFGARRMHPAVAPVIERAAYIGGCNGVATVLAAERLGIDASGTMPHSLVLLMGSTVDAALAFEKTVDARVPRVVLIDTFNDEKFEALRVAEALGDRLFAVRLDTPASRRGNFRQILQEVRWELDTHGFEHVRLFVSGGLTEPVVEDLVDLVDGFGVGTEISGAPVMDFSMDIVEIEGEPVAKRGKMSGSKSVWRCSSCAGEWLMPQGVPPSHQDCGAVRDLVVPMMELGRVVGELPAAGVLRERVLAALGREE